MATQDQIDAFHRFATEQLRHGGKDRTLDELYDQWRDENQSLEESDENVAAIRGAIDDMNAGDAGRDVGEVIAEVRSKLNFPASP